MASSISAPDLRAFADLPSVDVIPDADLDVYINLAYLIRTEDLSGTFLSPERLDAIELNLAAHFAIQTYEKGGLSSVMIGTSEDKYRMVNDKMYGLMSTRFGQTALSLDKSGILSSLMTVPLKARFNVI